MFYTNTRSPVKDRLPDDHHRAGSLLCDPVGGRAEEVVAQEVAAVPEDDEVVTAFGGHAGDQLGRMPGADVDVELDPGVPHVPLRPRGERREEDILLALHLLDLPDRRSIRRPRPFGPE